MTPVLTRKSYMMSGSLVAGILLLVCYNLYSFQHVQLLAALGSQAVSARSVGGLLTIGDESRLVPSTKIRRLSEGWLNVQLSVNRTEHITLWATLLHCRWSAALRQACPVISVINSANGTVKVQSFLLLCRTFN